MGMQVVRQLEKDEVLEVVDGPHHAVLQGVTRMKGRALSDNMQGRVTCKESVKPWASVYKRSSSTTMQDSISVNAGKVIRHMEPGEIVDLLEGPAEDAEASVMWIRARARKDGVKGWLTLRVKHGTLYFSSDLS